MNLNIWMCKHLDDDKKGYVTIFDVLLNLSAAVFIIGTPALYIHGAISLYKTLYVWPLDYIPPIGSFVCPGVALFILGSIAMVIAAISYVVPRILHARIATCENIE